MRVIIYSLDTITFLLATQELRPAAGVPSNRIAQVIKRVSLSLPTVCAREALRIEREKGSAP
jgi:hypothetical protein